MKRQVFENYVAEGIRMISENTARNGGHYLSARYIDLIDPQSVPEETAEQIITRMKGKLRKISGKGADNK